MKKVPIVFFLLAVCTMLSAQDLPDFSLGLVFGPASSFRTISAEGDSAKNIKGQRDLFERPKWGYTTGLTADWIVSDEISLQTAVLFSNYGERLRSEDGNPVFPSDTSITKLKVFNHYAMLEWPLILKYYSQHDDPFSLYFKFGAALGLHLYEGSSFAIKREGDSLDRYKSDLIYSATPPKLNVIGILGVGFEYMLSDHISLTGSPTFRYVFKPVIDTEIKEKLFSLGLDVGIQLGF